MSKIKRENLQVNRTRDLAHCAVAYLLIHNCPGGRPIVDGYVCPHCGTDTSFGDCGGVIGFKKKETAS